MQPTPITKHAKKHWLSGPRAKQFKKIVSTPRFARAYVAASVVIVLGTTLFWSLLGARLQQGNADQLANTDLFENLTTFRGATFPGAHSFLLKWPLFWLIKVFGSSGSAIIAFTVATVLLTVAALVVVVYKIERRPLLFGTICLALASTLLLVPAQPYAGAILPVNMAMLATRNLEYVLYIMSLIILVRSPRLRSWSFWLAVGCLSILIASDKLFLVFSAGAALVALIMYARTRTWSWVSLSVNWLIMSIIAGIIAIGILAGLNGSHLTHISNQSSASPYGLSGKASSVVIGSVYAVLGLLTNFGANPAFDATIVRNIPHQAYMRLTGLGGPAYLINAAILAFGLWAVYRLLRTGWSAKRSPKKSPDKAAALSIMLIWTTVVAVASFIATNHYYAVDARYLAISLFAVFISIATYTRHKQWRPELVVGTGLVIIVAGLFGLFAAGHTYSDDKQALAGQNGRNTAIAQVLANHPVNVLAGDYWRVLPARLAAGNKLNVMPLSDCTQARQSLSSQAWQPDLHSHSFAYLLTLDGSLTDYPNCTLKQVVNSYGRPNTSTLIAGNLKQPKELLLFYDRGIHKSAPATRSLPQAPATVLPITPDQLPYTSCDVPSITNIVAHQDDDLLFMNPDLLHDIKAGHCVRTIYMTAGDDGAGKFYWLSREQGSEAAYAAMLGSNDVWIQRIVELSDHEFITVANPKGNAKISLIFMHLPDGNLKGEGFKSSHDESLAKLAAGKIGVIHSVDNQSYYSSAQLVTALSTLFSIYQPAAIHTQAGFVSSKYPDHSDHLTVGQYAKQAYKQYEYQQYANQVLIPLKFYIGYPIHQMPVNISDGELQAKEAAFLAYAKHDGGVCQTLQTCQQNPAYGAYLARQYQNAY
jgi:LmbE family N-acetylglucosaminyl deacetylase